MHYDRPVSAWARLEPAIAGALILGFAVACAAMHVIQPELSLVDDAVSFYMNGRLGSVLGAALVALGVGSLLVVRQFVPAVAVSGRRAGMLLLGLWAVGCMLGGIFPPDPAGHWKEPPSFSGMVHNGAAMVAFVSFPIAAMLLSRHRKLLSNLARFSVASTVLFFACLAPVFAHRAPFALGLAERIVLAVNVAWLLAAQRLRQR